MAGRMTITEIDLRLMLDVVRCAPDSDGGGPMPYAVLDGLRRLVGCDNVSVVKFSARQQIMEFSQEAGDPGLTGDALQAWVDAFWTHYWSCRFSSHPDTAADLSDVVSLSDFYSDRQLRHAPMYQDCLRLESVERSLLTCLPDQAGEVVRVIFFRSPGSDFADRDRGLLTLLRPHLTRIYRQRRAGERLLTGRQRQLLRLVAAGYTNDQIGRRLSISEATARKHLENIFARLGVTSRTAAVTAAFDTGNG
jgi:DNA-binding CsgD family transcriptional regulator